MKYTLEYQHVVVTKDISKLTKIWKEKIKSTIENKLLTEPELYGKPLRRSLRGYRKLRVSDYRVIFKIEHTTVKIFAIGHRSTIYTLFEKRALAR
ncbi:MAG: type II toxin-antitoxin system RelE/ParE family toxin [bacterium]|nr:type II toxin-antitoxin system RelE/ParE family toxin [bacterium]